MSESEKFRTQLLHKRVGFPPLMNVAECGGIEIIRLKNEIVLKE